MIPSGESQQLIWGILLHLSYNMWSDRDAPEWGVEDYYFRPYLRFDESLWNDLLQQSADAGLNMIVIDLGDGVVYRSHPEIAVEGAWSPERLRSELSKIRDMGMEPIPKLNFSTSHDAWMGPYSRCVSTEGYYQLCRDLIAEVVDLFDGPRLFHLGMDEETARHQRHYAYAVMRQHELWWHDFFFLVDQVEKAGVRPWIWSDYVWHHPGAFLAQMPTSVMQSNWYYGDEFGPDLDRVCAYNLLEEHGYDQIPTGSTWLGEENFPKTVAYCDQTVAPERLRGYLQAPWHPTLEKWRQRYERAIELVAQARVERDK